MKENCLVRDCGERAFIVIMAFLSPTMTVQFCCILSATQKLS